MHMFNYIQVYNPFLYFPSKVYFEQKYLDHYYFLYPAMV